MKITLKADNSEIPSSEYSVSYKQGDTDITESVNAGTYTVVISGKAGGNYTFSGDTKANYEIKTAALTVTAKDKSIDYGGEAANDGVEYSGFVNNETASVLTGTLAYAYNSKELREGQSEGHLLYHPERPDVDELCHHLQGRYPERHTADGCYRDHHRP